MKNFGPLLGFNKDQVVTTKTTSSVSASLTNKLKDILIFSNIVDYTQVYSRLENFTNFYTNSSLLATLSIDTTQALNGNFTEYNLNTMKIPSRNYHGQELEFVVESGGEQDDYEIYLTLEVY